MLDIQMLFAEPQNCTALPILLTLVRREGDPGPEGGESSGKKQPEYHEKFFDEFLSTKS